MSQNHGNRNKQTKKALFRDSQAIPLIRIPPSEGSDALTQLPMAGFALGQRLNPYQPTTEVIQFFSAL